MIESHNMDTRIIKLNKRRPQDLNINKQKNFAQQNVELSQTPLFFPEGFEKIFLLIYFVTLPYIAGLFFLFFYVAEGKVELFLSLNDNASFILTWAIGYEVIAAIIMLLIIKMYLTFALESRNSILNKQFRRP